MAVTDVLDANEGFNEQSFGNCINELCNNHEALLRRLRILMKENRQLRRAQRPNSAFKASQMQRPNSAARASQMQRPNSAVRAIQSQMPNSASKANQTQRPNSAVKESREVKVEPSKSEAQPGSVMAGTADSSESDEELSDDELQDVIQPSVPLHSSLVEPPPVVKPGEPSKSDPPRLDIDSLIANSQPTQGRRMSFFMGAKRDVLIKRQSTGIGRARIASLLAEGKNEGERIRRSSVVAPLDLPKQPDVRALQFLNAEQQDLSSTQACDNTDGSEVASSKEDESFSAKQMMHEVWDFLDKPYGTPWRSRFHDFYKSMIILSVVSPILETANVSDDTRQTLHRINFVFCLFFSIELLLKFICCPSKLTFVSNIYTLLDTLVVAAGYVDFILSATHNSAIKMVANQGLILRLLEITRQSDGWPLFMLAMKRCVGALRIPMYLMLVIVVLLGSLHYWIDKGMGCNDGASCPDKSQPAFESIPHAMWFVIVTVATVGYGDVTPNTVLGKILAAVQILAGVGYMAMPLAIIGTNFSQVWEDRHRLLVRQQLLEKLRTTTLKEVQQLFDGIDKDRDGNLDRNEFSEFTSTLKLKLSKRESLELFQAMDIDGSNSIGFEEFVEFVLTEGQEFDQSLIKGFSQTTEIE